MAGISTVREQQRVEHLVLGRDRPKVEVKVPRPGKRKPIVKRLPATLLPGIEEQVALRERWARRGGTPETHEHFEAEQQREGSIARLSRSGAINAEQLGSAVAIAAIAERLRAEVGMKTANLQARIDSGTRAHSLAFELLGHVRREYAYRRWFDALRGVKAAIVAIIVDDVGLAAAARSHGLHHRRLRQQLLNALDLWPVMMGQAAQEIDAAILMAAHTGILA